MSTYSVTFMPHNKSVRVQADISLLEAALQAGITINNLCGGDGICGRCKMIVTQGKVTGRVRAKLTRDRQSRLAAFSICASILFANPHQM